MTSRTVLFLAVDRMEGARTPRLARLGAAWGAPRCLVQICGEVVWDGDSERYAHFDLETIRIGGAAATADRLARYATRLALCEQPLLVSFGGRRTLFPALRWLAVIHGVPFPEITCISSRVGTVFGRLPPPVHFDIAQYLGLGGYRPEMVLAALATACGVSDALVRDMRRATLGGALLRVVATTLIYFRLAYVAGRLSREVRIRAEHAVLDLLVRRFPNRGAAVALWQSLEGVCTT